MLALQIYTNASGGEMLADYGGRARGVRFSTNKRGFSACRVALVPMPVNEAFEAYEWPGTPHVVVSDGATGAAWEGRLEDIAIVEGGLSLTALGYARAMLDVPYTALWSKSSTSDWRAVTEQDRSAARPAQYEMDNNNRLYIAPRKDETYATGFGNVGELTLAAPHGGARNIVHFSADYSILLPSGWKARLLSCNFDFSGITVEATITGTGSLQTGTWALSTTARQRIIFSISNDSGSNSTITAETGVNYARLTAVRIKSASGSIYASDIAAGLRAYVSGINPAQLAASDALIAETALDLRDEIYEDAYPADILDRLALLHGYEWGVYEGRVLHFRRRGSAGRDWYVDTSGVPELQRSLEKVRNSAYAVYRAGDGATMRTATVNDPASWARYGITRRGAVGVQTTSASEAETHRDVWLRDRADMQARARIEFDRVFDTAGGQWPLWAMRAGDTVTMRNLPPTLASEIDRIRTFRIGETNYDADSGEIDIAPDEPVPTLVTLVARRGAGL